MHLFTRVTVSRFRSIRDDALVGAGEYSVLAGLNNSGKSNFLRALHLFFKGSPEPGVPFDIDRDYYRPEVRSKKKKAIQVRLDFSLPDRFHFRKGLESVRAMLGDEFSISKRWVRGAVDPEIYLNDDNTPLSRDDSLRVEQFLSLITFRYIPNRVVPTDVIEENEDALRDMLIRRLSKYKSQTSRVLDAIRETANTVTGDLAASLGEMVPDISEVRLDTADSLAELAFRFGYQLAEGDIETNESEQGSGIQSLLMFQTLHLIDRDFFQQFGWKQAAVWAVEEPESSLHTALEAETSRFLAAIAHDPRGRLQVVATTHSDLMIQQADASYLIKRSTPTARVPWRTTTAQSLPPRELLTHTARSGISRWVNPILFYYLEPLILVEGKTDQDFITKGLRLLTGQEFRVASLASLLDDEDQGGVTRLKHFIQANADAIRARASYAPVIAVLDWEEASKVPQFSSLFKKPDPFHVIAWPEAEGNPLLDSSFKGIERFFSDDLIARAETVDSSLVATKADGSRTVHPRDYDRFKSILASEVTSGITDQDLVHARPFLLELCQLASA